MVHVWLVATPLHASQPPLELQRTAVASFSLKHNALDSFLDEIAAIPAAASLCLLRDRRQGAGGALGVFGGRHATKVAQEAGDATSSGRSLFTALLAEPFVRVGQYKSMLEVCFSCVTRALLLCWEAAQLTMCVGVRGRVI